MFYKNNMLIKTFSSIEFALLVISAIAITSIAGTVVPQGESLQFYAQQYGGKPAVILELLDITNMYSSYWFHGLLILFCLNLIICTWIRLPGVLSIIKKDNLALKTKRLAKDPEAEKLTSKLPYDSSHLSLLLNALGGCSFKKAKTSGQECLFFHERGAWSRTGAYIVHASILLIILGALVGKYFGYKGFVMVPEGTSKSSVYQRGAGHEEIPLGFEVYCQNFKTDYYPNGSPKEYKSDLQVLEAGTPVLSKSITVNDPLKYKGVTFFQSSYQAIDNEYKLVVTKSGNSNKSEQIRKTFFLRPQSEEKLDGLGASIQILASSSDGHGHGPYKIQFTDSSSSLTRLLNDHEQITIKRGEAVFTLNMAQRYATGLQVVKDPGVWIVYAGCGLMLLGLYVSFFMSHIRVWVLYLQGNKGGEVIVLGKTNKNTMKMERLKEKIITTLLQEEKLALRRM